MTKAERKKQLKDRILVCTIGIPILAFSVTMGALGIINAYHADLVSAEEESLEPYIVEATGYYSYSYDYSWGVDAYGNKVKKPLVEGVTIAGRACDLGKVAVLYSVEDDGSIGEYIGTYEFRDVGYGQSTGYGNSKLLKGKSLGTIEAGQCVDIYFDTYEKCVEWGRRNVYIQIIGGKG